MPSRAAHRAALGVSGPARRPTADRAPPVQRCAAAADHERVTRERLLGAIAGLAALATLTAGALAWDDPSGAAARGDHLVLFGAVDRLDVAPPGAVPARGDVLASGVERGRL